MAQQKQINLDVSILVQKKIGSEAKKSATSIKERNLTAKGSESHMMKDEPICLHIWDFAGHELYYTTHQVQQA